MSNKQQNQVSPIGTLIYPHLGEPNRKFNPEGTFEVGLRLPAEEAEEFKISLQTFYDQAHAEFLKANPKKKNLEKRPLSVREDLDDEGNPTGDFTFRFKMKARITLRDGQVIDVRPTVADSKGNKFDANKNRIGTGSRGRVSFVLNPYNNTVFGVSMQLRGVQVIDLVEPKGGVSFDPVEDGWTAEGAGEETGGDY